MNRISAFALPLLLGLSACQPSKELPAQERPKPPPTGGLRTQAVAFRCGEQEISVQHLSDTQLRLSVGSESFDLERVPAASGAKYTAVDDSTTYFWSKDGGGLLQLRGESYPECERTTPRKTGSR